MNYNSIEKRVNQFPFKLNKKNEYILLLSHINYHIKYYNILFQYEKTTNNSSKMLMKFKYLKKKIQHDNSNKNIIL